MALRSSSMAEAWLYVQHDKTKDMSLSRLMLLRLPTPRQDPICYAGQALWLPVTALP